MEASEAIDVAGPHGPAPDVALVRWPAEAERRAVLRAQGRAVLLLVSEGAAPPASGDILEDWVRLPVDDADLRARVEWLSTRVGANLATVPAVDVDGVLRYGEAWVALPPVEARLTLALTARFGAVVSRDALGRAGWPEAVPDRNVLDVHVLRLRRRLAAVDLAIRTIRSRGYLLEPA